MTARDRAHPPVLRHCFRCGLRVWDYEAHTPDPADRKWYHPECCPECNR